MDGVLINCGLHNRCLMGFVELIWGRNFASDTMEAGVYLGLMGNDNAGNFLGRTLTHLLSK